MRTTLRCRAKVMTAIKTVVLALAGEQASQIAEFAISAPLLIVFIVGIFDFSGAFNLKQKITSAAQAGALTAANQFTRDLDQANPPSVVAVETSVFNYLANDNVLSQANVGSCKAASAVVTHPGTEPSPPNAISPLVWQYTISGCGVAGDNLVITIDRGDVQVSSSDKMVLSDIQVTYPHHWLFNRVITLVVPSSVFSATTQITVDSVSQNLS